MYSSFRNISYKEVSLSIRLFFIVNFMNDDVTAVDHSKIKLQKIQNY